MRKEWDHQVIWSGRNDAYFILPEYYKGVPGFDEHKQAFIKWEWKDDQDIPIDIVWERAPERNRYFLYIINLISSENNPVINQLLKHDFD